MVYLVAIIAAWIGLLVVIYRQKADWEERREDFSQHSRHLLKFSKVETAKAIRLKPFDT